MVQGRRLPPISIVHRLVQWWDADKAHWRRVRDKKPFPSIAADLGTQLSNLVRTLAVMVVRCSDSVNDERTRSEVTRVAEECCADKVPALQLEIACAYVFASSRDSVLHRVEDAMASSRTESVIDALEAMDMVSHHGASRSDNGDLMQLLRAAGQMIRWRRDTALWATLSAVGEVVNKHPWTFVDEVESYVLAGLGHLVIETAVGGKNGVGIDGNRGPQDVSRKLIVRRAAAKLAHGPRWTPQNRPFRAWRLRLVEFYLVASVVRKSDWIFVRQLRGPHVRTWP